jgi:aspartyl/asparaginyl beta-hydroxylase (cupin superfamily)
MFLMTLAAALRALGKRDEELATLERVLAIEPRHLVALLQKGAVLELMNKPRSAATVYSAALQTLSPRTRLAPPIQAHVEHARKRVVENAAKMEAVLADRLHSLRARADSPSDLLRLDRCVERMLGRTRIYVPEPTATYFPFLKNYEFHPRKDFPWLEALESATEVIREELLAVLSDDRAGMRPYIAYPDGLPLDQWQELNHSRRWSAYFLWNDGQREDAHMARCPRTVATLAATPQVDIAGRAPIAFFSILDAHTHIPPHTGVTNTRLTVHLPLIVPSGCRFRVGGETREWRCGEAWVFDDTIEHEAWNDADVTRVILIFDVWNPQLTALERDLVRELTVVFAEYGRSEGRVPGVLT